MKMASNPRFLNLSSFLAVYLGAMPVLYTVPNSIENATAAGGQVTSPVEAAPDRYAYYPGTEALDPDEMRVVACGTGMPSARHGQAATCFLVELGNGDKFLFESTEGCRACSCSDVRDFS